MKLGAREYILKLSMKTEELLAALGGVAEELVKEEKKSERISLMERQMNESRYKLKNDFFRFILEATYYTHDELIGKIDFLRINLHEDQYAVAAIKIDNYRNVGVDNKIQDEHLLNLSVMNILEEVAREDLDGEVFMVKNGCYAAYINISQKGYKNTFNAICNAMGRFTESIQKYLGISASAGISGAFEDITELRQAYKQAEDILEGRFYRGKGSILWSDEKFGLYQADVLKVETSERLELFFQTCDTEKAVALIDEVMNAVAAVKMHPGRAKKTIFEIFQLFEKTGREYDITAQGIDQRTEDIIGFLDGMDIFEDIRTWVIGFCRLFMTAITEARSRRYNKEIVKAVNYIRNNFANPKVSAASVAAYVCMNPDYFSHLFKKETGENFTSYLTGIRMQEAVKFIKTSEMKLFEIAQRVGYENFSYFSRLFKKVMGANVSEYQKNK